MTLMNYDRSSLSTILNNLLNNTDSKLREVQKMKCPRTIDIDLKEVTSKTYRYMEKDYTTTKRLFIVNNPKDIYKGGLTSSYNGNIKTLFDKGVLVPFLLMINSRHIAWSAIDCIIDDKNIYLAFNHNTLSMVIGDDSSPANTSGMSNIPLAPVDDVFLDTMKLEVNTSDTTNLSVLMDNMLLTPTTTTATKLSFDIPRATILTNGNKFHELILSSSVARDFKSIRYYSTTVAEPTITSVDTILIPVSNVTYTENASSFLFDTTTIKFAFDNGGQLLNENNYKFKKIPYFMTAVTFNFPYYGETSTLSTRFTSPISNKFKLFKENFMLFNNTDFIYKNGLTECGLNVVERVGTIKSTVKTFYWYDETTKDKLLSIQEKINLMIGVIDKVPLPDYTTPAHIFDFQYDSQLSYDENMDNFVKFVADYDSTLLGKYIDSKKYLYTKSYILSDVIPFCSTVGSDYKFIVPKDINGQKNNGAFVLLDGLIYDMSKVVDRRTFYEIYIPTTTPSTTVIEVILVANVNNSKFTITVPDANTNMPIGNAIKISDIELHSSHYLSQAYSIPESEALQYNITCTPSTFDGVNAKITMDASYYNRPITVTSKRKFVFETYTLASEDMVILSDKFKYCNNQNQYMIFYNGRKLNNESVKILLNDQVNPFNQRCVFIPNKVQAGDKITVIYLPEPIRETYISEGLNSNGVLKLRDSHKIKYSYVFVNGKKIPLRDIIIVSADTIKIKNDTKSLKNVYLYDNLTVLDDLLTYIKASNEMWSQIVNGMDLGSLQTFAGDSTTLTDTETDITTNWYTHQMIIFEIIRRFFILNDADGVIDAADIFFYDFDDSVLEDGTIPLDASIESMNELPENTIV